MGTQNTSCSSLDLVESDLDPSTFSLLNIEESDLGPQVGENPHPSTLVMSLSPLNIEESDPGTFTRVGVHLRSSTVPLPLILQDDSGLSLSSLDNGESNLIGFSHIGLGPRPGILMELSPSNTGGLYLDSFGHVNASPIVPVILENSSSPEAPTSPYLDIGGSSPSLDLDANVYSATSKILSPLTVV